MRFACCVLSCFSHVRLVATPWAVTHQAPLSMGFSRRDYWSGLPFPSPEDLPDPEIEPVSLASPALAGSFFTWEAKVALVVKNPAANAGDIRDMGSIPGSGRYPVGGHDNPLQYSCLENPMERGAWWVTVQGITKSWTRLKRLSTAHTLSIVPCAVQQDLVVLLFYI